MKSQKSLAIVAGLTALVVGYVIFDFQYEKYQEEKAAQSALLLNLSKEQINEIQIERFGAQGASEKIILQRSEKGWLVDFPIQDLADQSATNDFVEAAVLERSQQTIKQGDAIDWKIYGLDQPKGKITFKTNSGQQTTFEISTQKNYMADIYLRKTGESKVYLAGSSWSARIDKQVYDFRDKRIFRNAYSAIEEVNLQLAKESYSLKKIEGKWKSQEKPDWKLDQTKAAEVSSMLSTTTVLEFTQDAEPSKAQLQKLGLKTKTAEIFLTLVNAGKWSARFFQNEKKEYFVQTSDPARLVKISIPDGDKIAGKTLVSLRDGREPFDFQKEQAKRLVVYQPEGKKLEFTMEKAESIVRSLRNLEVKNFEVKDAPAQFQDYLEVLDQDQKTIFKLSTAKVGAQLFVKTNLYSQVVGLEEAQIKNLGVEKLFQKEETAEKATEGKQ